MTGGRVEDSSEKKSDSFGTEGVIGEGVSGVPSGGCHALEDAGQGCREGGVGGLQLGPRGLSLPAADSRKLYGAHLRGTRVGCDPPGEKEAT